MPRLLGHSSNGFPSSSEVEPEPFNDDEPNFPMMQHHESPVRPFPKINETPVTSTARSFETAKLQMAWDTAMEKVGGMGRPHKSTAVLLISWSKELDDLNTAHEVVGLEHVFRDDYNYQVVNFVIQTGKRVPQFQVLRSLVDFVEKYDDGSTLLLVYYAGHGVPGKKAGELNLHGWVS